MQTRDVITITISAFALLLSLVATIIAIRRGRYEQQRALRSQVTDILSRIVSSNIDYLKLLQNSEDYDTEHFMSISSMFSQQAASLVHQAMYLIDQVPKLVTALEYNTVAITLASSGDIILADIYYRKAVDTTSNGYYKALATRSYAAFIFRQRRFEDARGLFNKSLSLFRSSDDPNLVRHTNGITYQIWALSELQNANAEKRAEELFESARNEFRGIDIETMRQQALNDLEKLRNNPKNIDMPPSGVNPTSLGNVSQSNI